MDIKFFCPRWGSEKLSWTAFFDKVKQAGYDGFEWAISNTVSPEEIGAVIKEAELKELLVIAQHYETNEADFNRHLKTYNDWFIKLEGHKPFCINSQAGRDIFSKEQNQKILNAAKDIALKVGVPIYHETHRSKFSFAAHVTEDILRDNQDIKLTLDASHWVNVAESYLEDQKSAIDLAIERTEHIHARVGHPQAVQVSDPFAPEWSEAFEKHLVWWDAVVERKRNEVDGKLSITSEFGPSPYMVVLPTGKPIVDQWEINKKMFLFLKNRYKRNQNI